jgi:uncharacterized protein (UPF0332 family)
MNDLEEDFLKVYDTLESAKYLLKGGFVEGAVNRIYYAYFYAAKSLLSHKDIYVKSHTGTQSKFAETFIKTGLIPEKYGKYLGKLEDKRQLADYESTNDFTKEDVQEMITWTEDFLEYIKQNIERL